jgi:hypothetical protein
MYIMAPEPIASVYFINPSHQSVCLHVYTPLPLLGNSSIKCIPPFGTRQMLVKYIPAANKYTQQ